MSHPLDLVAPPGAVVYLEEPEAHASRVRELRLACRGPYVLPPERVAQERRDLQAAVERGDLDALERGAELLCIELRLGHFVPAGSIDAAAGAWARAIDARRGCGQDLTEIVVGFGQGGRYHEYACPRCGAAQSVTTALYWR